MQPLGSLCAGPDSPHHNGPPVTFCRNPHMDYKGSDRPCPWDRQGARNHSSETMSAPGRTRTCGQVLRRHLLFPLSYGGGTGAWVVPWPDPVEGQDKRGRALYLVHRQGRCKAIPRWSRLIIAGRVLGRSDAGAERPGCCPLVTALLPQPLWIRPDRHTCPRTVKRLSGVAFSLGVPLGEVHPIGWPGFPQGLVCPQLGAVCRRWLLWCSRVVPGTGGLRREGLGVPGREPNMEAGL
jgi:hypothetical protein